MAKIAARLLRLLLIVILACIVFILIYAGWNAIREFCIAIPVAFSILGAFFKSNALIIGICAACVFIGAIFYDRIKALIKNKSKKDEKQ